MLCPVGGCHPSLPSLPGRTSAGAGTTHRAPAMDAACCLGMLYQHQHALTSTAFAFSASSFALGSEPSSCHSHRAACEGKQGGGGTVLSGTSSLCGLAQFIFNTADYQVRERALVQHSVQDCMPTNHYHYVYHLNDPCSCCISYRIRTVGLSTSGFSFEAEALSAVARSSSSLLTLCAKAHCSSVYSAGFGGRAAAPFLPLPAFSAPGMLGFRGCTFYQRGPHTLDICSAVVCSSKPLSCTTSHSSARRLLFRLILVVYAFHSLVCAQNRTLLHCCRRVVDGTVLGSLGSTI